jgi:tetratricopeptide (TPR) repeat protein
MRSFIMCRGAVVALTLAACVAVTARGDDDMAKAKVLELNAITGSMAFEAKLKDLRTRPEEAKKLIDAGLKLAKDSGQISYHTALLLAQTAAKFAEKDTSASARERHVKAAETFYRICADQAAKLNSTRKLLDAYGGLIDLFYEAKKFEQSARVCREVLELKLDDGKPRVYYMAQATPFGGIDYEPVDSFDAAKPLHSGVHRLLIQAVAKQGKYDQALKLIDNLIRDKDHWQNRQLKAIVLAEAGKYGDAAKTYIDVIERIGKDKDLEGEERDFYLYRNRTLLSNVYVELKQIDKAAELMESLLQKRPDDPGIHNDLGYILADHDMKLDYAETLIRKALDLDRKRRQQLKKENPQIDDRDNGAYLDSLGWVLFKQKKYKEAKEVLLKAVEDKKTQHIEIYDHLGDVCLVLGEREAALSAWREGLKHAGEGRREAERKVQVEKKIEKHSK